jgi:predicted AlkP superfamily phosphohydrolase/phosphomutase
MNRRKFLKQSTLGLAALSLMTGPVQKLFAGPFIKSGKFAKKVFVLGIDGMDPNLLRRFMQRGEMPTFLRFIQSHHFGSLRTTLPPQSPVAWSSFITGLNPGGHGIFDFIHRDPRTFTPYLSTSRSRDADKTLEFGKWSIPLGKGKIELLRRGRPFWEFLEEGDIPALIFKIPANFPVKISQSRAISGMGTPDMLGSYGTFTLFTDVPIPNGDRFTGGRVVTIRPQDHRFRAFLEGPPNAMRTDRAVTRVEFTVDRDPMESVIKIRLQDREMILNEGEWSDWIPLVFEVMPLVSNIHGMVRIYVQQVHPHFRIYASPINVDPMKADLPISSPKSYARELSEVVGRFYTQGFPEDTKALSNGVFSDGEFFTQSKIVLKERLKMFDYELNRFNEGLFFFYFSSLDQNSHMMLRLIDPAHPLYDTNVSPEVRDTVYYYYRSMDDVLKQVLGKMDSDSLLLVMSDHGFAPFYREFHLSTWLVDNGFTAMTRQDRMHESNFYDFVDWSQTKAYAMGLNSIYINVWGREVNGSVLPEDVGQVKKEIIEKLQGVRDPLNGKKIVIRAYDANEVYSGDYLNIGPDIVIGYNRGYRISDEAALGKFPRGWIENRKDKWSYDHCMDPSMVPGVLLTNRKVASRQPSIWDLAPSILSGFGIRPPREMDGKSIFS